jgi:hypothetical protein
VFQDHPEQRVRLVQQELVIQVRQALLDLRVRPVQLDQLELMDHQVDLKKFKHSLLMEHGQNHHGVTALEFN